MSTNGIHVLNGSMNGEEEGEYTFIGKRVFSTVDYVMPNLEARKEIKEMTIR